MQKESRAFQPVIRENEIEIDLFILIWFSLSDVYDSILNFFLRKKNLSSFKNAHVRFILKSFEIFITFFYLYQLLSLTASPKYRAFLLSN